MTTDVLDVSEDRGLEANPHAGTPEGQVAPPDDDAARSQRRARKPKAPKEPKAPKAPKEPKAPKAQAHARPTPAGSGDLESVLLPSGEWFSSMLRGFLTVYVVALVCLTVWLRTTTENGRLWIVVALSLPVLYQLALRPLHRRIALRGIIRRPSSPSLFAGVALGAMVLTASTTIADSVVQSRGALARRHLGPLDVFVVSSTEEGRLQALAAVERQQAKLQDTDGPSRTGAASIAQSTDGRILFTSTRVMASSEFVRSLSGVDALEFSLEEAQGFGNDPKATGLEGTSSLTGQSALIGADLAKDLRVSAGAKVTISVGQATRTFVVERVLPRRGLAALAIDARPRSRVLFVPRGSASSMPKDNPELVRRFVGYSGSGAALTTWRKSRGLADVLSQAIDAREFSSPESDVDIAPAPSRIDASAVAVKADLTDFERAGTAMLAPLPSALAAIAGIGSAASLIAALVLALERRRREVMSFRSVGISRGNTLSILAMELWLVSLASIVIGSALGWAMAGLALARVKVSPSTVSPAEPLGFPVRLAALSTSITAAACIAMATIVFVGYRHLRPKDSRVALEAKSRWKAFVRVVAVVGTIVIGVRGALQQSGLALVGGTLAAAVLVEPMLRLRFVAVGRRIQPLLTVAMMIVALLAMFAVGGPDVSSGVFGLYCVLLLVGACWMIGWFEDETVALPRRLRAAIADVKRPLGLAAVPVVTLVRRAADSIAGALLRENRGDENGRKTVGQDPVSESLMKAQRHRRPTQNAILRVLSSFAVFSAVVAILLSSSVDRAIRTNAQHSRGRFQAVMHAEGTAVTSGIQNRSEVSELSVWRSRFGTVAEPNSTALRVVLASPDEAYSSVDGVASLAARAAGLSTDREAFVKLFEDPTAVIIEQGSLGDLSPSEAIGRKLFVADEQSGRSTTMTVIGVTRSGIGLGDVIMGPEPFARLRANLPPTTSQLLAFAGGVDTESAILGVRTQLGVEIDSFEGVAAEVLRPQRTVAVLLKQLAKLMLLGGLLTAFVIVRTALDDRRRDLASLRTLGAVDAVLRRVITSEYRHAAFTGAVVGGLVAVPAARFLLHSTRPLLPTAVPFGALVTFAVVLTVLANLALVVLASRALRGSPAAILHRDATSV